MSGMPYVGRDGVNYRNRWIYLTVSIILIVSIHNIIDLLSYIDLQDFGVSDLLINFEGGFVRRGLFGELVFKICKSTGWSPRIPLFFVCVAAYAFVFFFFLKKFLREGYSWWFLFSPLFLGLTFFIVRKDFIEYSLLIFCLLILKDEAPGLAKRSCATALTILALFIHEAFIFWGFPIIAILLLSSIKKVKYGYLNIFFIILILSSFALQAVFKGDREIAISIVNSWNSIYGSPIIYYEDQSGIGALGWTLTDTVRNHFVYNTVGDDAHNIGLFWQPLWGLAIYYFCTNFIFVFHRKDMKNVMERQLAFSCIYILTFICMIPLFALFSCDYGRLYQHLTVTACASLVTLSYSRIIVLLPNWFIRIVTGINSFLASIFPTGKRVMLLMLLFLSISPYQFSLTRNLTTSVVGKDIILFVFKFLQ